MLSIKCPNCGGTVQFDEQHIATFCSFCGSHLPDMTEYVKKAAELEIEKKQHALDMEAKDKELIEKELKHEHEMQKLREEARRAKIRAKHFEDPKVKRVKALGTIIILTFVGMILFLLFITKIL